MVVLACAQVAPDVVTATQDAHPHVLQIVRRMAAQGCVADAQAAGAAGALVTRLVQQTVVLAYVPDVLRVARALAQAIALMVVTVALGAVIRDAQAAPGAQAHALDVRHVAAAPDALPGAVGVVTTAAPDRVSYHAAETAHQRVLTPVLGRVPQSWQTN